MTARLPTLMLVAVVASGQRLVEGNPESSVRVIIYEDLQCSDCAAFRRMLDEKLLPKYGARVAFEHRDFPLARHAWARKAAIAGRFFQSVNRELAIAFRRRVLAEIRQITPDSFSGWLAAFAKSKGVDPARAVASLEDAGNAAAVEKDFQEGVARGVSKTPTVFVNGAPFVETFTVEEISKEIDAALAQSP
jgi:protein-disulfide isomerase